MSLPFSLSRWRPGRAALMAPVLALLAAAPVLALLAAAPVLAQSLPGFFSPTRNIACGFQGFTDDRGEPVFACEIYDADWDPPQAEYCDLDQTRQVAMTRSGRPQVYWLCHGDTWLTPEMSVLDYGDSWEDGGILCTSSHHGMRCENSRGRGFLLRRRDVVTF